MMFSRRSRPGSFVEARGRSLIDSPGEVRDLSFGRGRDPMGLGRTAKMMRGSFF